VDRDCCLWRQKDLNVEDYPLRIYILNFVEYNSLSTYFENIYIYNFSLKTMSLFENIITVVFQSVFHLEMYQNNIFLKKTLFLISKHQNDLKILKKY